MLQTGRIPINLDLDGLFQNIEKSKTIIRNLKDGCVYILSLLTVDNYYLGNWKDGYTTLNNKILEEIIGQKRPKEILDILNNEGVIETRKKIPTKKSSGYRLSEKYNTGEFTYIKFSDRIIDRLEKNRLNQEVLIGRDVEMYSPYLSELSDKRINISYPYLFEQFKKNPICINQEKSLEFIKNLGKELIKKTNYLNPTIQEWTKKSLYNYLGRLSNLVEDFNKEGVCLPSISTTNHRLNSKITYLPKILRPFLYINGESIGEVDISSSQPYILSTILNDSFSKSHDIGYNLYTIFPFLYMEIENSKKMGFSHTTGRNFEILGVWFDEKEMKELEEFLEFDFSNDFYSHILDEGVRVNSNIIKSTKILLKGRKYIKKHMMNFLFNRNDNHRKNDEVIKLIKEVYPQMCRFIDYFHQQYTSSDFSYLLQRTESYLVLGNVCREINILNQNIPFYTIHDSIITTQTFLDQVKDIMLSTIRGLTGKSLNVKIKTYNTTDYLTSELVDEEWKESILITTLKKYDRNRTFYLGINISRGKELLNRE